MKNSWPGAGAFRAPISMRLILAGAFVALAWVLLPLGAQAANYFVDSAAPGPEHDGRSWRTAWLNVDDISNLLPGDVVDISGGRTSKQYSGRLQVSSSGTAARPITIRTSSVAGHNGTVVLVGPGWGEGIQLYGKYVNLIGRTWRSLRVTNYDKGLEVFTENIRVSNLELDNNKQFGLSVWARNANLFRQLTIHDNPTNVLLKPRFEGSPVFNRCWIFNTDPKAYQSDGVAIGNGFSGGSMTFAGCVLGPGLKNSFTYNGGNNYGGTWEYPPVYAQYSYLSLSNCLLINPSEANFSTAKVRLTMANVTSFLTPLNGRGTGHSCLTAYSDDTVVQNSIFYGGTVTAIRKQMTDGFTYPEYIAAQNAGIRRFGPGNVQFRTSGQTIVLSATQVNPQFNSQVASIPNAVRPSQLYGLDFQHAAAPHAGSRLISIGHLLGANLP